MEEAWDRIGQPVSSSGACVPIIKAHEGDELNQPNHRLVVLRTAGPMNHGCSIELLLLQLVDTATTVVIPLHWRAIVPGECCYLLRGRHTRHEATVIRAVL